MSRIKEKTTLYHFNELINDLYYFVNIKFAVFIFEWKVLKNYENALKLI